MIVAFVYDFPHFKSAQGLFALKRAGHDVRCVAAPRRELGLAESHYQFRTVGMDDAHHPREAAKALGYSYEVTPHQYVRLGAGDVGLVLGARVLARAVVESGPIVNLHPGVLPFNRGLDTLKWAVHDSLPQGVAAHVIDHRIDRGAFMFERVVDVLANDGPADIYNRVMWAQIDALSEAMRFVLNGERMIVLGDGVYRKPMTPAQDLAAIDRFDAYKRHYATIRAAYDGLRAAA